MDRMWSEFSNPDCRFRGKPFWAWNGKLEAEELRRQIRVMKQMGLGGFFMHSRVGLNTAYLSDEWFEMIAACNDEARKQEMEAWLYDEDRWPSGAAGGLVTKDPKHSKKLLQLSIHEPKDYRRMKDELAAYVAEMDTAGARNVRRLKGSATRAAGRNECIMAFRVLPMEPSAWYNGYTYLDTLSTKAVEKFIEVTHEAYRKRIGPDLGNVVPGIFTDEPNFHGFVFQLLDGRASRSWTDGLPDMFRKRHGYDLMPHLPELFVNVDGNTLSRARLDYYELITHLFVDNFARLIYEWCDRNKIASTGHVLLEETLAKQTRAVGAAQRFYEYMQAPGIDILTDREPEYLTAKQCCSVANQFNRKWVLSELYGCTGWDFSFEGHKAVGDWQTAAGVTLRCHHLSYYTMLGQAKRDYPASISYQSPWWRDYGVVEDYYSRITAALTRGKPVRDVLVVHPIESYWALYQGMTADNPQADRIDAELARLQLNLLQQHVDFDYGDEEMMSRHSKVSKTEDGPVITLAKARYRAVVVPPCAVLRSSTVALLEEFHRAGGVVLFVGELPHYVDGQPDESAVNLAAATKTIANTPRTLSNALAKTARSVSLADAGGRQVKPLIYQLRKDGDLTVLFVCSRDRRRALDPVTVTVPAVGKVQEWDAMTGESYGVRSKKTEDGITFTTSFPPAGSRLFVIDPAFGAKPGRKEYQEVSRRKLTGAWDIARDEPNMLLLDIPEPDYGDGRQQRDEILRVDFAIRDRMGLPRRGGEMVQPWARTPSKIESSQPLDLRYTFEVKDTPTGPLKLAIEMPERFTICVNGQPVPNEAQGWWVDLSLQTIPLAPWLFKPGRNTIDLHIDYTEDDGLEACFLLGEFGVKVLGEEAAMLRPPARLAPGNWCRQGLPFYAAAVTYSKPIRVKRKRGERVFLTLPKHAATHVKVRVDGKLAGSMPWAPYEVDLTDLLTGDNVLDIEVISSRRNAFGPMHWPRPGKTWVGPASFITSDGQWTYGYQLVPYGLLAEPELSFRRRG